ncbi:MAG: MAC/perforin domain-containing protein [Bacteroidota bacterium]
MKKNLLLLAFVATLVSCTKNQNENAFPEEKLSADIDLVVKGATQEVKPLYPSSDVYNFLGYGYDVTDKFVDEVSVRASVLNVTAYAATGTNRINMPRSSESSWKNVIGKDAANLSERLSNMFEATRGFKVFGNTIQSSFPTSNFANSNYVYAYYSYYMIRKRFEFYYESALNDFITNDFRTDISKLDAEQLVKKYGTHVLRNISVGAKFDVVYQANATEGDKENISMEGQRYALKNTFGLMTGYLDPVNLKNLNANSSAKIYYSSIGGDLNKLKTETINNRLVLNISNWVSSTTEEKARFMGIASDGLVPLYHFISDNNKKAEVKQYIEQYIDSKEVKLTK